MDEGLIARRYAKAVLRYSRELGAADLVYEKMKLFEANYIAHPDLQKALLNPLLSPADKEMLLSTAIGIEPGEAYIKGIRLVIRNHREMYVRQICLMFQKLYREVYGIIRVKITTAAELPKGTMERIEDFVRHRYASMKIEFAYKIDSTIIGGFVLQIGTKQLDASLMKELKEIGDGLGLGEVY
ncbi:ATP synthase F1 subunit delta [Butyricimonas synergistica]|uniref:ATP synthase F1 subunit delta n=1 Tax=Butyricimonas synergistica TaxID=544644 RepID=UPI0003623154|nr:ATP synthase F1 subunit delta [Butyricimonas synergistica]